VHKGGEHPGILVRVTSATSIKHSGTYTSVSTGSDEKLDGNLGQTTELKRFIWNQSDAADLIFPHTHKLKTT
jgi:hypothetical protein